MRVLDRELVRLDRALETLLLMTPIDAHDAFLRFEANGRAEAPEFHYRPLGVDLDAYRRELAALAPERVDDPSLRGLLAGKRRELELRAELVAARGTPEATTRGARLYGRPDERTVRVARAVLHRCPASTSDDDDGPGRDRVSSADFAAIARRSMEAYRRRDPEFRGAVELRDDIGAVMMVSGGRLLIGRMREIARTRVEALVAHEVETHVLTWHNGARQPLGILSCGLRDYDELQEGLAVLAEFLVGGLTASRLRLLAARVLAAKALLDGAAFAEVARLLRDDHAFASDVAFTVTMRVFRGGGLVKDMVYLRGLDRLLSWLAQPPARGLSEIEGLFAGKIAAADAATIVDLTRRGVLAPPALIPAYLGRPDAVRRLEWLRAGREVIDLI